MTGSRFHRWGMLVMLSLVCLVLGGLLAWQLSAPPPTVGKPSGSSADDATTRRAGTGDGGDGEEASAEEEQEDGPRSDTGGEVKAGDDFTLPPLSTFSSIVDRPLFTRGRRPAPPSEAANAAAGPNGQSPFLLSGVMIAGSRRVALLQTRTSPKTLRVEEGETVEGWKVVTIRPQTVTLKSGANTDELELPDRIGGPPPLASQPPPRPAPGELTHNPSLPPPTMPPGRPTEQPPNAGFDQE